jgi:hypothetical protein
MRLLLLAAVLRVAAAAPDLLELAESAAKELRSTAAAEHAQVNASATARNHQSYVGGSLTSDGYCYSSVSSAFTYTACTILSQIQTDSYRSGACYGASSGYIYYCPAAYYTGSSSTSNGYCYATSTLAFSSTSCTMSQITTDMSHTGACSGAPPGFYNYCPLYSPVTSFYTSSPSTSNGYCYSSATQAYLATVCTSTSQILTDSSRTGACSGAPSGVIYYCPATSYYSGSSVSSNGICYASASQAYGATVCTSTSQILTDFSHTGACSGAPYGIYYYCPASAGGSGSGYPAGAIACGFALASQPEYNSYSSGGFIALNDATCATCGKAGYCPYNRNTYSNLDTTWFACVSGGSTVTRSSGVRYTYCTTRPTGGFYAVVIVPPFFFLVFCILLCCRFCTCCAWNKAIAAKRQAAQPQGIMMNPMQPTMMQPVMMAGAPAMGQPMMMAAPAAAEPQVLKTAEQV